MATRAPSVRSLPVTERIKRNCCSCNSRPEQYVLFKLVVDLVLIIVWLPSMLYRTSYVYRKLCPPLWSEELCDRHVRHAYYRPAAAFGVLIIVLGVIYTMLYRYIRQIVMLRHRGSVSEEKIHTVFGYFAVFLWVHIYVLIAWILYVYSMDIAHMVPLLLLGVVQDFWILGKHPDMRDSR